MNLVLLSFGENKNVHSQATFCILSFLKSNYVKRCCVVTDHPEFYRFLEKHITILELDSQILQQWRGSFDFFWRIKIKAIQKVVESYPNEDIIYVDSDTFLARELNEISEGLSAGKVYMHQNEGLLSQLQSKTEKKMWLTLKDKTFASQKITNTTAMWNAGVIAIPAARAQEIIQLALRICDEICATNTPRRLVEQFAFSLALASTNQLSECSNTIGHYWGNKEGWTKLIQDFLIGNLLKGSTVESQIQQLAAFDFYQVPLVEKRRSIKTKLDGLTRKMFPNKSITYFK